MEIVRGSGKVWVSSRTPVCWVYCEVDVEAADWPYEDKNRFLSLLENVVVNRGPCLFQHLMNLDVSLFNAKDFTGSEGWILYIGGLTTVILGINVDFGVGVWISVGRRAICFDWF